MTSCSRALKRALWAFCGLLMFSKPALAAERPNILLVIWDTTRADHLSFTGYERQTTPHLAKLAADGANFQSATSSAWWTPPGVAGIFTGMFQHNNQVDYQTEGHTLNLTEDVVTLAEALKAQGYKTAGFFAQKQLSNNDGFGQGFDAFERVSEAKIIPKTMEFIDSAGDDPWFVMAYWVNPHAPYSPREAHDLWSVPTAPDINLMGCTDERVPKGFVTHCQVNRGKVEMKPAHWKSFEDRYDGELRQNDADLEKLWKTLKGKGLTKDLLFAFTSDHGELFNDRNKGRCWHKSPYEPLLHVPLVIRYPGKVPRRVVRSDVRTIDLYPTILELIGSSPPEPVNGESLLPLVRKAGAHRPSIAFSKSSDDIVSYRTAPYKLIYSRGGEEGPRYELYNLRNDPTETKNIAKAKPDLVKNLRAQAETLIKQTTLGVAGAKSSTDQQLEALKALGYVE